MFWLLILFALFFGPVVAIAILSGYAPDDVKITWFDD